MKNRFIILMFLILVGTELYSQDKIKAISSTFLKLNPDDYADNISQIHEGDIVTKINNADWPYILVNFNSEIGYVNKLYFVTSNDNIDSSSITLLEEPKLQKLEEAEEYVDKIDKPKLDTENDEKKISETTTNSLLNMKWDNNYFFWLLFIPIIFLGFFVKKFLKPANEKYEIDLSKKKNR